MIEKDAYEIPSEEIQQNRKLFYNLRRERDQLMKSCFLVIDKFTCGLKLNEMKLIESSNNWTLKQLEKYLSDEKIHVNVQAEQEEIYQNEESTIDIVKYESVSCVKICIEYMKRKSYPLLHHVQHICFDILFNFDTSSTMTMVQTMRVMKVQMKWTS